MANSVEKKPSKTLSVSELFREFGVRPHDGFHGYDENHTAGRDIGAEIYRKTLKKTFDDLKLTKDA